MNGPSKEMKQVLRRLRKELGVVTCYAQNGHVQVTHPTLPGKVLVSSTTKNRTTLQRDEKRVRRKFAGVPA